MVICGDALIELQKLRGESVHCCVTSPPYWGLRDYGTAQWEGGDARCDHIPEIKPRLFNDGKGWDGNTTCSSWSARDATPRNPCSKCGAKRIDAQLGLEKTPEEYVTKMVEIFREVRRVLRKDGTLWLNLGDSYTSSIDNRGTYSGRKKWQHGMTRSDNAEEWQTEAASKIAAPGLKPKDLCGIPWRVAFALQADGWYLRQDIIWAKPNPMPESVTDRCTKAHEYLFLLTKSPRYFYDAEAIREPELVPGASMRQIEQQRRNREGNEFRKGALVNDMRGTWRGEGQYNGGRNKRSVWTVATAPYPEAHFATYPPDLIKPCILAGTSASGCCANCGAPWERVTEQTGELDASAKGSRFDIGKTGGRDGGDRTQPGERFKTKTLGWQPTCRCEFFQEPPPDTIPCTALDPFAGSGTTGQVALELGRKAILIELNPKYIELIKKRCDVTPGLIGV
jgi:DNA modification methylase